jgi:hypothetical protein
MKNKVITLAGILGALLGITAFVTVSLFQTRIALNFVLALTSFVLLLTFFIAHFELFKTFSKKRATQLGLNSILMIILFVFIAVVFNLISRQYYFRTDLSSTGDYSLAEQTVNVVRQLQSVIRITVLGQEQSPSFLKAKKLLESYRYFNKNIVYSVIDLDRAPLLAKEYEINKYDSIIIETERSSVVVQGISEETITNGIIKATKETMKKIYFIAGHGEKDINNKGRNGVSTAASKLTAIGYKLSTLVMNAGESVPDDADLLILLGPQEKFSTDDINKVDNFMAGGGKLIGLFDPGYDPGSIIGKVGIQMMNGQVSDASSNLGGRDPMVPLVSSYPDTPVTKNFTLSTVYPGTAALDVGALALYYEYFTIAATSPESLIVQDGKPVSGKGEQVIAAVAGSKKGKDIIMVFGDSDFASNAFFHVAGNGNLFLNSVNWILEEGDLVSIIPRKDDFIPLYLTPEQGTIIFYVFVAGMPTIVFGLGFTVWWKRRRL